MKFCKMSGNITFQLYEANVFGPSVFFFYAIIMKSLALILPGEFEFTPGHVREFWSALNV